MQFFINAASKTAELLEHIMGLEKIGEEGEFVRFRSSANIGNIIDLKLSTIGRVKWVLVQFIILLGERVTMLIS